MNTTTRSTRTSTAQSDRPAKRAKTSDDDATSPSTSDTSSATATDNTVSTTTGEDASPMSDPTIINAPTWMSSDALERLNNFLSFAEPETNRFAVTKIPPTAKWGTRDFVKYLCINEKPITVWIIGTVESKWFVDRFGEPQNAVNITIKPLREIDRSAVGEILSKSQPKKVPVINRVYAKRFMLEWQAGEPKPKVVPFDKIYDATFDFGRKSSLPTKGSHEIGIGDVVLVEAAINRYKTGSNKYRWDAWNVSLELQYISIIAQNPEGTQSTERSFTPEESDTRL